jgi:hypothetical protein
VGKAYLSVEAVQLLPSSSMEPYLFKAVGVVGDDLAEDFV